jgi:signal transduction histidine kinase
VVDITVAPHEIRVSVVDKNERGGSNLLDGGDETGIGLVGMRERVESLGGEFEAGPTADGWCVRAHLPRVRFTPNGDAT